MKRLGSAAHLGASRNVDSPALRRHAWWAHLRGAPPDACDAAARVHRRYHHQLHESAVSDRGTLRGLTHIPFDDLECVALGDWVVCRRVLINELVIHIKPLES